MFWYGFFIFAFQAVVYYYNITLALSNKKGFL
jgi:hypothetical protein